MRTPKGAADLDAPCGAALDALDLGEQLKSARAVTYARDFRGHLTQHVGTPVVLDLTEQAADFRLWTCAG